MLFLAFSTISIYSDQQHMLQNQRPQTILRSSGLLVATTIGKAMKAFEQGVANGTIALNRIQNINMDFQVAYDAYVFHLITSNECLPWDPVI